MSQTLINSTAVLSPFIEKAYGAGNATPQVNFDALNTEFNTEKAAKKAEYQSLTQIGNTLDAARYAYIEQDINNLLDKAGKGEIVVGSPEWVAAVSDLTNSTEQLSIASKVDAELTKKAVDSPDKFRYFYQNENGDWLDGGMAKYKSDMLALKDQDFSSPQERVFAEAEIAKRANIAKRSIADGYKELAKQAEQLNKELNSSAGIESKVVKITLGSEIIELTSQLDSSQTQAVVDMFVNQFADDLTWEYAQKDAKGEVPMKNGRKMTPQEYVTSQVKAFITQGDKKREIRSRPQPRAGRGGVTETEIERARNVKPAVREAIDTKDPAKILEYVSPFGYRGELTPDGKFRFYTIDQQASGNKAKNIKEIELNEESLYDFIADVNDDVSRAAIDTFNSPSVNPENQIKGGQRLTETKINKQIKEAETEIDGIFENWNKSSGTKKQLVEGLVKNFNLSGVSFKDPAIGFDKIVIDGQEYDEEDIVTIKELISAKIKDGSVQTSTDTTLPKKNSGIGAKYNTK